MFDFLGFLMDGLAWHSLSKNPRDARWLNGCLRAGIGVLVLIFLVVVAVAWLM